MARFTILGIVSLLLNNPVVYFQDACANVAPLGISCHVDLCCSSLKSQLDMTIDCFPPLAVSKSPSGIMKASPVGCRVLSKSDSIPLSPVSEVNHEKAKGRKSKH